MNTSTRSLKKSGNVYYLSTPEIDAKTQRILELEKTETFLEEQYKILMEDNKVRLVDKMPEINRLCSELAKVRSAIQQNIVYYKKK